MICCIGSCTSWCMSSCMGSSMICCMGWCYGLMYRLLCGLLRVMHLPKKISVHLNFETHTFFCEAQYLVSPHRPQTPLSMKIYFLWRRNPIVERERCKGVLLVGEISTKIAIDRHKKPVTKYRFLSTMIVPSSSSQKRGDHSGKIVYGLDGKFTPLFSLLTWSPTFVPCTLHIASSSKFLATGATMFEARHPWMPALYFLFWQELVSSSVPQSEVRS